MKDRYSRNSILSPSQQKLIAEKKVAVIGSGGLGGYVAEMLARLGIRHIVICDGDSFDVSNLNRQIFCTEDNLGKNKASEACKRIKKINSEVSVKSFEVFYSCVNSAEILKGCDAVIDCLDTPSDKLQLSVGCADADIPLIHGAVNGWFGQVCTVFPGENTLKNLYGVNQNTVDLPGNPSFSPAVIAGIQVSEAVKVLLGEKPVLRNKALFVDLFSCEFKEVEL